MTHSIGFSANINILHGISQEIVNLKGFLSTYLTYIHDNCAFFHNDNVAPWLSPTLQDHHYTSHVRTHNTHVPRPTQARQQTTSQGRQRGN
jgi:hypothetical protein